MARSVSKRSSSASNAAGKSRTLPRIDSRESLSLKNYPKVRRALPILLAAAVLWYVYSRIWATHLSGAFTVSQGLPTTCNPQQKQKRSGGSDGSSDTVDSVVDSVVMVDSLVYDKLRTIGGTGHWFHLLERIVPSILRSSDSVWRPAYEGRGRSVAQQHLYIVFQEAEGAVGMDSFCRLMLASVLGGGYYDKVFIGHSAEVLLYEQPRASNTGSSSSISSSSEQHLAHVRDFQLVASLLFHPGEEVGYSEALAGVVDHHSAATPADADADAGATSGEGGGGGERDRVQSNLRAGGSGGGGGDICAPSLMTLSWDLAPAKRYDLMGGNSTIYDLLHSTVDRACGWEQTDSSKDSITSMFSGRKPDVFVEHMQALHPGYKKVKRLSRKNTRSGSSAAADKDKGSIAVEDVVAGTVYREDSYIIKNEFGAPLEQTQIQAQMLQAGTLSEQDELSFPTSERFSRKLTKYRKALCASHAGCNGTSYIMKASNGAGLQVLGWKEYAAAQIKQMKKEEGIDNQWENAVSVRDISNVNAVRSAKTGHNVTMAPLSRNFILPVVPAATDAPLTVLVYDRDQSRRLVNPDAVVGYLQNALKIADDSDRHAYFPLYFSDEGIPRASPKRGIGSIGEINQHKVKHITRRKSGRHVEDVSNQVQYGHAHEKDQWVVNYVVHNSHGGHNEHVHVSGVSGNPLESADASMRSRYPSYEDPPMQDFTGDPDKNNLGLGLDISANADTSGSEIVTDYINVPKSVHKQPKKAFGNGRRRLGRFPTDPSEDDDGEGTKEGRDASGSVKAAAASVTTTTTTQHHPPCELLRQVMDASVLITPHGFQSILLLFQPKKSLYIEVMPFSYHKPEIFGMIQAGLRSIPTFGELRSYLVHESHPTSFLTKTLHFLGLTGENAEEDRDRKHWFAWSQSKCTNWAICRHIVRNQDVVVDESFLRRTADFIKNHFVNNKAIKNTEFFD